MGCDMVGLVALDFILRGVGRGVVRMTLVVKVAGMDGDDPARNAPGFRIPGDMIADLEVVTHVDGPLPPLNEGERGIAAEQ